MEKTPTAGFIAQELDSAETTDNAQWLKLVMKDNPDKWEATYGNLLPVVVKAVQELNGKNEKLEAENKELKDENVEMKSEIEQLKTLKDKVAVLEQMILEKKNNDNKNVKLTSSK
jgi:predicted RNase H-like nuclease (RuvC/YqgF family)